MTSNPDISVVIVNWNTRELLRDCLTSVFAKPTALQLEVLVVDNASTDDSAKMVRESFREVRLIENHENVGFARANNQAFPFCLGSKIVLLNSDTVVAGDALGLLARFLDDHSDVGAVAPKLEQSQTVDILGCGRALTLRTAINHWLLLARLFPRVPFFEGVYYYRGAQDDKPREVDWISGACMMVRRSVIDEVGPLSEQSFMYAEDQEWCSRMRRRGWKIFHLPNAVVEHRHGASFKQNPELAALPYQASRQLFVELNNPSRLKLLLYDLVVTLGLTARGFGESVRSLGQPPDRREIRRRRAQKFLSDAKLTMANVGRPA